LKNHWINGVEPVGRLYFERDPPDGMGVKVSEAELCDTHELELIFFFITGPS
jgi:hypothetical protein